MALCFTPHAGTVLMCDYGMTPKPPEMVKCRPVVVVSPKFYNRWGTCVVVPISGIQPKPQFLYHIQFEPGPYPFFTPDRTCWAKCDMLGAVAFRRLDRVRILGRYSHAELSQTDFARVRAGVASALGIIG
jgi:uncharacterized protein YifN (PemK superfamily)